MKRGVIFAIILVVAAGVLFFSFFWPLNSTSEVAGTLGGIEKAQKYRGDQPMTKDVLLENEDFATLTQSAEWQNAMKDEEFVAFLKSDEFQKAIVFQNDIQNVVLARACFEAVKNSDFEAFTPSDETMKSVLANDFQGFFYLVSQEFQKLLYNHSDPQNLTFSEAMKSLLSSDMQQATTFFSADMQKVINSQDFDKMLASPQFDTMQSVMVILSQDIQKWMNQNMQQFLAPNAADMQKNAAANNQEFQKSIGTFSQEFQKAFMSQEVQEAIFVLASDTQQCIWVSQDYQKYYSNANFQALNSVMFIMSSDIQNSFLCAFDDYMKMW
jgi:hypothetical protein